ncbi:MAG: hypothetical protein E6J01_17175, partial [Chloroflexi bacterium]
FPEAARHVVEALAEVYKHDAQCRKQAYSPEQRLSFHRQHSQPVMEDLHTWITGQMQGKLVEPNSALGKALNYLTKHWSELTVFLREVGAPIDNNLCEQVLKRAIIHRKGSLFRKRSGNPSFVVSLKLRTLRLGNQRTRRDEHGSTADGALPGTGGGISGIGSEGEGMGRGERCTAARVGELVCACETLAGAA